MRAEGVPEAVQRAADGLDVGGGGPAAVLAQVRAVHGGYDPVDVVRPALHGAPDLLQAGQAVLGQPGQDALAVLVARDDPLDTYVVHHPDAVFARPVEATVLDPANPHVLAPHLCAAAAELPLTDADLDLFGPTAAAGE